MNNMIRNEVKLFLEKFISKDLEIVLQGLYILRVKNTEYPNVNEFYINTKQGSIILLPCERLLVQTLFDEIGKRTATLDQTQLILNELKAYK